MAVHVPLTQAAQIECWTLMLSANNLLDPANGKPIVFPSQDMVLGINYLTREMKGAKGTGKYYDNISELILAIDAGSLSYNALIKYKLADGSMVETTPGRVLFNAEMPPEISYQNLCFGDKELKRLVGEVIQDQKTSVARFHQGHRFQICNIVWSYHRSFRYDCP
jgi:DNA-directed RNA polymerase subunit beta'